MSKRTETTYDSDGSSDELGGQGGLDEPTHKIAKQTGKEGGRPSPSIPSCDPLAVGRSKRKTLGNSSKYEPSVSSCADTEDNVVLPSTNHRAGESLSLDVSKSNLPPPSSAASRRSYSPSKTSTSPSRQSSQRGTQVVGVETLASLKPSILVAEHTELQQASKVTELVIMLWLDFIFPVTTRGAIPMQLKGETEALLDTPKKTRNVPLQSSYGWEPDYNKGELFMAWKTVKDVWISARTWGNSALHEETWGILHVSPLLDFIKKLDCYMKPDEMYRRLEVLDVRNVEILHEMLSLIPKGMDITKPVDRKIDFVMGLGLTFSERRKIQAGNYAGSQPSINQTFGFTRHTPIFLNIEVKRPSSSTNPIIQLAVWIAAEFQKRVIEGWDRSMPVTAVTVDGNIWQLYIVYEPDFKSTELTEIVFLGPIEMGSTQNLEGTWRILSFLDAIARWGRTTYYEWFLSEILSKV